MGIEEASGRALSELMQRLEIFVVGLERAARAEGFAQIFHDDAMELELAEFARPRSSRQSSLVDEAVDEGDPAQLREQRGIEVDLVDAAHDLARARGHVAARVNTRNSPVWTLVAEMKSSRPRSRRIASKSTKRSISSLSGLMLSGLRS